MRNLETIKNDLGDRHVILLEWRGAWRCPSWGTDEFKSEKEALSLFQKEVDSLSAGEFPYPGTSYRVELRYAHRDEDGYLSGDTIEFFEKEAP